MKIVFMGTPEFSVPVLEALAARHEVVAVEGVSFQIERGEMVALIGASGVGKSTLVNALAPDADRATGIVNEVTGRGRHTSSSVRAIRLPESFGNAWVIDTPGVRSFGLGHVKAENILKSFEDLYAVIETCPRDCSHLVDAPDCALDEAITAGTFGANGETRVDSLRRLMASINSAGKLDE